MLHDHLRKLPAKITVSIALILLTFSLPAQVKPTPADERLKSLQKRKELENKSLVNNTSFRNIGPAIMSGRVVDIDVNPNDPTEIYVAYATGGLWHSNNNGQSFTPIFDSEDVIVLGDIAVNWNTGDDSGKNRIIWAGTGEVNSSRSSYAGIGVYKSTNNGKTWEYMGLPESQHIGKVQLHPTDPNTVWVAALGHLYSPNKERGVFKTTDGGKSWKHTLAVDENTGAVEIDINPQNPNELYAAMWYKTRTAWNLEESGKTSGIYKSTDGGNTWSLLTKPDSGFPSGDGVGRIGLAVFPKNPQIVYAIVDNNFRRPDTARRTPDTSRYVLRDFEKLTKEQFEALDNRKFENFLRTVQGRIPARYTAAVIKEMVRKDQLKPTVIFDHLFDANTALFDTPIIGCEVYRSDNGGQSWRKTNAKPIGIYSTYGYYFGMIFVSPYDENKVVITGVDLLMSTDGGKEWKSIDGPNVHSDHHFVWMNPKKDSHIINGNDGGLNITYDNGKNWFKANTPSVGQYYAITVDNATPYNVYGGLQDNGSWVGPSNNKESINWMDGGEYPYKRIGGGDGMQVQVDTRDNATIYSGSQFGSYNRRNWKVPFAPGQTRQLRPSNALGEQQLRFNWQTPILLSKHNQDVFYYGSNKVHRSLNRGDSMVVMSTDLTNGRKEGDVPYGTLTTLSESPIRFGLLYAGTDDGNIHVTKDGGYTWALISKPVSKTNPGGLPQGLWVSRVTASQFKEGRVYATLNGYRFDHFAPYLFVSDDYGTTWKQIGKDLPYEPLNVVREDPKSDSILYVGTDGGLYVSIDAGNSFMMWTNGLPKSIPVHDIAIQQRENEIVLGTHGRSLYIAKLDNVQLLLNPDNKQKQQTGTNK